MASYNMELNCNCIMVYCKMVYCNVVYRNVIYRNVIYCNMFYCDMLDCDMFYCNVFYCDMLDCDMPLPEPVESSQNGIWTSPLKIVELHFAPHRCLCGPVST